MPDDLLRFVSGPGPTSGGWLWLAGVLVLAVIGWYVAVFVWTSSPERNVTPRIVARANAALLRRRFARDVRQIGERFRSGESTSAAAAADLSRTLREFLTRSTGAPAQYMQVEAVAAGELAPAAPLLLRINDVQFNARSTEDVAQLSGAAEELILQWT